MKKRSFSLPEFFYCISFLLWLTGSAIAHIRNGIELSLWLMGFAIMISFAVTVFPWLGIRWLRLTKKGYQFGRWLSVCLQVASWGVFTWAMFLRLNRTLPPFHTLIAITTLIWAVWMLLFIYSRHACQPKASDDTLGEETRPNLPVTRNHEDL